jgi:ketosteroid isomerase-like protein
MKRTITFLLLAMAVLTPAQAQKKETGQGTDATSKTLIDLENKWIEALEKSDAAALDAIFADTYVDTDEMSHRSDKQAVLAVAKSGDLKIESIKLSDMQVHVYGDAAVVTGSAAQAGNFKGHPLTAKIIFTDTFVKQNGKWRAVASHRSTAS